MDENPYKAPVSMPRSPLSNNVMTPKALFHVAIATLGLFYLLGGVVYLFQGVTIALHLAEPYPRTTVQWYAVKGVFQMLLGYFVMSSIPLFSGIAFRERASFEEGRDDGDNSNREEEGAEEPKTPN